MSIRIAQTPQDFAALDALIAEYEEGLPPNLRHSDAAEMRAHLEARYQEPNAALIALDGSHGCGCVFLTALDATTAVITKMYVQPSQRGKGLARSLMDSLVEAARRNGFSRIVLDTDAEQLRAAYRLYQSLGFTDCEPYGPVEYANPTYMELLL